MSRTCCCFRQTLAALLLAACSSIAAGQCEPFVAATPQGDAPNRIVHAMTSWDSDGPGPAAPLIVLGGEFTTIGTLQSRFVAFWDGQQFIPTTGAPQNVRALLVTRDNRLYAAGDQEIAHFNGAVWTTIDSTLRYYTALIELNNGDLLAAGTVPANADYQGVIRLNGVSATQLGAGFSDRVTSLAQLHNGDIVAAGFFQGTNQYPPAPINRIARWTGSAWQTLGGGTDAAVKTLLVLRNGDLVASGHFRIAGGVPSPHAARWNGATWLPMGSGAIQAMYVMHEQPDGSIIGGHADTQASWPLMSRWNGSCWLPFLNTPSIYEGYQGGYVAGLASLPNGSLAIAGEFSGSGPNSSYPSLRNFSVIPTSCACAADLTDSLNSGFRDNAVTIEDLLHYLRSFDGGRCDADVDDDGEPSQGTRDGAITIDDLLFFLARFEQGC